MNWCNFCGRYDDVVTITLPDKYQRTDQQQEDRIVVDLCKRCKHEVEHEG
jgi:hypothetical protein